MCKTMNVKSLFKELKELDKESMQYAGTHDIFELENKLCRFYDKKYCILFNNATTALLTLGIALDIKKQHIISSPLTWGGTISPFLLLENKVTFTNLDEILCLKAESLKDKVRRNTRAVISVDYGGTSADSKSIKNQCEEMGLFYISDSAQSLGAFRDNKPAGYFADAIITSFTFGKTMYGGEGGAIILNDNELYERIIYLSQHPLRQKKIFGSAYNKFSPINGRINPFSALLLNQMFDKNLKCIKKKQKKYFKIITKLKENGVINLPKIWDKEDFSTYFSLYLRLNDKSIKNLSDFEIFDIDNSEILSMSILDSEYKKFVIKTKNNVDEMINRYKKFELI